jgi:hypothetical protein
MMERIDYNKLANKLVAGMLFILFMTLLGLVGYVENHYSCTAEIVEIDGSTYTVETPKGNLYQFDIEEYQEGDEIKIYFDGNHTDTFSDDIIYKVKFEDGYIVELQ